MIVVEQVWTGSNLFWMRCLREVCLGESCLQQLTRPAVPQFMRSLLSAEDCLQDALTHLMVSALAADVTAVGSHCCYVPYLLLLVRTDPVACTSTFATNDGLFRVRCMSVLLAHA